MVVVVVVAEVLVVPWAKQKLTALKISANRMIVDFFIFVVFGFLIAFFQCRIYRENFPVTVIVMTPEEFSCDC